MINLSIESSTRNQSVCILNDTKILEFSSTNIISDKGINLVSIIKPILSIYKNKIDFCTIDIGPGFFTPMRDGISIVRAIGQLLDIPVISVTSFELMNYTLNKTNTISKNDCVIFTINSTERKYFVLKSTNNTTKDYNEMDINSIESLLEDISKTGVYNNIFVINNKIKGPVRDNIIIIDTKEPKANILGEVGYIKYNKGITNKYYNIYPYYNKNINT